MTRIPCTASQRRAMRERAAGFDQNMKTLLHVRGKLDIAILHQALSMLITRHEMLRTRFWQDGGEAFQEVVPTFDLQIPLIDLPHNSIPEAIARIQAEISAPIDLGSGLRLRVDVFRVADEDHLVRILIDHIAGDGFSQLLLLRELYMAYRSIVTGAPLKLAPQSLRYTDYALWQRKWLAEDSHTQTEYWLNQFAGLQHDGQPLPLLNRSDPKPSLHDFEFGAATAAALGALRRESGTSFTWILAAYALAIAAGLGERNVVIESNMANRTEPERARVFGYFSNRLPLLIRIDPDATCGELARQVRKTCWGAYLNTELPIDDLHAALQRRGGIDVERLTVFRISFLPFFASRYRGINWHSVPWPADLAKLTRALRAVQASVGLQLTIREKGHQFSGRLLHDAQVADAAWMDSFVRSMEYAITSMAAEPNTPVRNILDGWGGLDFSGGRSSAISR